MSRVAMIVWNEFRNDARVLKEAQTLQSNGHEVTVFALYTPGLTPNKETLKSGIKVRRVARSPLWKLRRRRKVLPADPALDAEPNERRVGPARQFARFVLRVWTHAQLLARIVAARPQAVHAHDVNTLLTAWIAASLRRVPLVYDAHEISTGREGYGEHRNMIGWLEKRLMPRAAATITTTDTRAAFFSRAYGITRPVVLQNRPHHSVIAPTNRIREELGLQEPWPIVLYQGGLQQGRGLERLVDAAPRVENAYFVFVGGGSLSPRLRQQVRRLGLEDRVHFISTVALDELPAYTASAEIGLQPIEHTCLNHFSTDSNKLFEYMMAGLPVIASSMPEIRKILTRHKFGLLVPPGDSEALVAALRELVADEKLRAKFSSNAREAAKTLNWEEQEHKLVDIYQRIVPASSG
jgi:glycosyltransferase involved in cell wall biosynthesis